MSDILILKGIAIGFALALPIGPIGILCIRKTVAEGHFSGMVVGFGAASADALYGFVAAFGLTVISDALLDQQLWIRLIGGAFLCYLGIRTYLAKLPEGPQPANGKGLVGSFVSTFFLTLTNPLTIIAFLGVFAGFGLRDNELSLGSALVLIAGVFLGSSLWFFLLSYSITLFRNKINSTGLGWVNKVSGILIVLFGFIAIASFFS